MKNDKPADPVNDTLKSPVKRGLSALLFIANMVGIMYLIKRFGG